MNKPYAPAIFVGHGSPENAHLENEFSLEWKRLGSTFPRPEAIVCISAHWVTQGSYVTAMDEPRTIHDFYGFPEELYQLQYPAPGNPVLATEMIKTMKDLHPDQGWGFDHGSWSVLIHMFPDADIPLIQLSLDHNLPARQHFEFSHQLQELRKRNILILGSGNIVHNLRMINFSGQAYPWAEQFDQEIRERILEKNFEPVIQYRNYGEISKMAVPTNEHFLPLLYILGVSNPESRITTCCEKVTLGSLSMTSVVVEN